MRRSAPLTYQRLCVHTARLSTCTRSTLIRVSRARVAWEEMPYKENHQRAEQRIDSRLTYLYMSETESHNSTRL